jgi:choline dehydrogenase-like flavoprotein
MAGLVPFKSQMTPEEPMANNPAAPEFTTFSLDNAGRYMCNTAHEALTSAGRDVGIGTPPADARPFDVIVLGGGTFGSIIAQHIFDNDTTRSRRILVLERGPYVLPEHFQNAPFMGGLPDWKRPWDTTVPGNNPGLRVCLGGRSLEWGGWSPEPLNAELADWPPTVVGALQNPVLVAGHPGPAPSYFQQAAEQIGAADTNDYIYGPLHTALREQLANGLAGSAAGSVAANLKLGTLPDHPKVRYTAPPPPDNTLRDMLGLPSPQPGDPAVSRQKLLDLLKLEAPLAVQSRADPGQFPVNKFSALPLLAGAARASATESYPYDQLKQVMVVPSWHVQELVTETLVTGEVRVTAVRIVRGWDNTVSESIEVPLAENGVVVLAQGTVETTRLARQTFRQSLAWRAFQRMGENLVAHLRSNFTIRVPRSSIKGLAAVPKALEVSALFVKGKTKVGGADRHFHLQITASGLPAAGTNSEAELFRKVPDWDNVQRLKRSDDTTVVITLRGIGEMAPRNPESRITENGGSDFGRPKALVALGNAKAYAEAAEKGIPLPAASPQTQADAALWEQMDQLADEVALMLAAGKDFEILVPGGSIKVPAGATPANLKALLPHSQRRDGQATTHHEGGTLRMGDNIADAVTDGFGRIHDTTNCFVVGPALFPTSGSPNPMLSGVALARRTADYLSGRLAGMAPGSLLPSPAPFQGDGSGWQVLFDGTLSSFNRWRRAGTDIGSDGQPACAFRYVDGQIVTVGAGDFALLWYEPAAFSDMLLKLQFRIFTPGANSGVFVRIRDPREPLPAVLFNRAETVNQFRSDLPTDRQSLEANSAWRAVFSGFEAQIDDVARGDVRKDFYGIPEPDGLMKNRTGAIYKIPAGDPIPHQGAQDVKTQVYQSGPLLVAGSWAGPGAWYELEIRVAGPDYEVWLGAEGSPKTRTTKFTNGDLVRGVPKSADPKSGYIALQAYSGQRVAFRRIQVRPL